MADIVTFGSDKPPWRPSRPLLVLVGVVVLVLGVGAAFLTRPDGEDDKAASPAAVVPSASFCTGSAGPPRTGPSASAAPARSASPAFSGSPAAVTAVSPAAIVIDGACGGASGIERRDGTAAGGPWTVVVRRAGGSLGHDGAVVTYPVAREAAGRGKVVKRLGDAYARVRGDLPAADLEAIAGRITISGGQPAVRPPAGLVVVASGTYRPLSIREVRYGSAEVGEQESLGNGLTFTGVAAAGGYEDALYAGGSLTSMFGGNGALAWEPSPGTIAFVAYSGATLGAGAEAALQRLAARARAVNGDAWRALRPMVAFQSNDIP
jgi:hypothetical protein